MFEPGDVFVYQGCYIIVLVVYGHFLTVEDDNGYLDQIDKAELANWVKSDLLTELLDYKSIIR
jgi:hypothetical protein